mmetsp:Transcript_78821/g.92125  ORF Transcript_78821/g.92125 Transcript_78821/m.92125 type:complete len:85 (-) Transcript_78821:150-404(-)
MPVSITIKNCAGEVASVQFIDNSHKVFAYISQIDKDQTKTVTLSQVPTGVQFRTKATSQTVSYNKYIGFKAGTSRGSNTLLLCP